MKLVKLIPVIALTFGLLIGTANADGPVKSQKQLNALSVKIAKNQKEIEAKTKTINNLIEDLNKNVAENQASCKETQSACYCTKQDLSPRVLMKKMDDQKGDVTALDMAYARPKGC